MRLEMENQRDITTIQLSRKFKEWLAEQAIKKDETYEEILRRLLPLPKKVAGTSVKKPAS